MLPAPAHSQHTQIRASPDNLLWFLAMQCPGQAQMQNGCKAMFASTTRYFAGIVRMHYVKAEDPAFTRASLQAL